MVGHIKYMYVNIKEKLCFIRLLLCKVNDVFHFSIFTSSMTRLDVVYKKNSKAAALLEQDFPFFQEKCYWRFWESSGNIMFHGRNDSVNW